MKPIEKKIIRDVIGAIIISIGILLALISSMITQGIIILLIGISILALPMKVIRNIIGTIIIIIGISGLFLPVIPGIVLIVLGFSTLSFKNKDKVKEYIKSTFVGKKMLLIFYKLKSYEII